MRIFELLIGQLNGSVFVLLVLLGVCFSLTYKIGSWGEMFKNHKSRLDKVESIKDTVVSLKTIVDLIYQNTNPNALVKSQSPISLTDLGHQIAENVDAKKILEYHQAKLIEMVEAQNPKNAYDIQQCAFSVAKKNMTGLLNEDELIKIKKVAFERGLLVDDIMAVFGVYLRNQILENKNIPISKVDEHEKNRE